MSPSGVAPLTTSESVAPNLRQLIERVWTPTDDPSWPVQVSVDAAAPGMVLAEEYVVVPNLRKPKFLVPVGAPVASRAAFSRYLTSDSTRAKALGWLTALAFGSGIGPRVARSRVFVSIDPSVPRSEWSHWLLLRHFDEVLEADDLVAYLPVRRAIPNAKPTMRLFERSGAPKGYAKIGWSPATREVVRNEAHALSSVSDQLTTLQAPALAASGVWQGNDYAIAAPLPAGVGPYRQEPSTTPELLLDIARSGHRSRSALAASPFARRLRADLARSTSAEPEASQVLLEWLTRLETRKDELAFGRWHGDFVPWNLGTTAQGPVAWDWEYSDPDVPVGFDLVHWHFQHSLSPADGTLSASVAAADSVASRLTTLGVAPESVGLVTSLFVLEVCTRAVRMAAQGAGWNAKLFPALMDVAAQRDV